VDSSVSGYGAVAEFLEDGNERSGFGKDRSFRD
jgi:hypothetical protein